MKQIEKAYTTSLKGRKQSIDIFKVLIENMYNIIYETSCQSRFHAWYWMLGAGALGRDITCTDHVALMH